MFSISKPKHSAASADANGPTVLETAIADVEAKHKTESAALATVDGEIREIADVLRAVVLGRGAQRETLRTRRAALLEDRAVLVERLADLQEEIDLLVAERAQVLDCAHVAIAGQLRPDLEAKFKAADAAAVAFIDALSVLRRASEDADAALSEPYTGRRTPGARAIVTSNALAAAHAFADVNSETLSEWRKDVAAAFAL